MKVIKVLFLIGCSFACLSGYSQTRGELISAELVTRISKSDIRFIYAALSTSEITHPINYEVDLYKVEYWTPEPRGEFLTKASGLLYVPLTSCDFPVVSYHHGTVIYGEEASDLKGFSQLIPVPLATGGYMICAADYVGYGSTPDSIPHAYLHAKSEATAAIDMLVATQQFCSAKNIYFSEQLFLTGYSQGAHVTMATHRELQQGEYNYKVTASAAGSGPYLLAGIIRDSVLTSEKFSSPTYTTFLLESFKYIYRLPDLTNQIYKSPYKERVAEIYNRASPGDPKTLPSPAFDYLLGSFVDSVLNGTHQFTTYLEENEVFNWLPTAPVKLFYCTGDEQVPYTVSLITADTMNELGALNVEAIKVADNLTHSDCFYPTADRIQAWFDELKEPCVTVGVSNNYEQKVEVFYPNVVDEHIFINKSMKKDKYQVFDLQGKQLLDGTINNQTINLRALNQGIYFIVLDAEKHLFYKK